MAGLIVLFCVVSAGTLVIRCSRTYECIAEFDFVDSTSVTLLPSERPADPDAALGYERRKDALEHNRRVIADNRTEDFRRWLSWQRSRNEWVKYIHDPSRASCLGDVGTNCLEGVLSGAAFEIVRMPCSNFVYGCRIRFAPSIDSNISRIAQSCMDVLSNFVADMNEVGVYKVAYKEFQDLRKRERRIAQLGKSAEANVVGSDVALELAREREAVKELEKRISVIRKQVLETGEKRITNVVVRTTTSVRLRPFARQSRGVAQGK